MLTYSNNVLTILPYIYIDNSMITRTITFQIYNLTNMTVVSSFSPTIWSKKKEAHENRLLHGWKNKLEEGAVSRNLVYIYMYIFIFVCIQICICASIYLCTYIYTYLSVCVFNMYTHICIM
jgi:hypothetical protein